MSLFVTGSESFVGQALVTRCDALGLEVSGIDSVTTPGQRSGFVVGDIRDPGVTELIPKDSTVVHLAAISRDSDCRHDPVLALEVNVGGTLNLLDAARNAGASQIIFASSEWVYGDVRNDEIQVEDQAIDITRMTSMYAMTKIIGEQVLKLDDSAIDKTLLRFGIIYGSRSENWSAVESLFNAVSKQSEVQVGCSDSARRFVHVDDIVAGILTSVGHTGVDVFNLSGDCPITLREVVERSASILGREVSIIDSDPESISVRNPDNKKAIEILNWTPKVDMQAGLESLDDYFSASASV